MQMELIQLLLESEPHGNVIILPFKSNEENGSLLIFNRKMKNLLSRTPFPKDVRWQGSLSHHLFKEGKGRIERHNISRFKEDKDLHPEDILILLQILFSRSILHNIFYCPDLYVQCMLLKNAPYWNTCNKGVVLICIIYLVLLPQDYSHKRRIITLCT